MKLYDREGNLIEVLDYRQHVLNGEAHTARVIERRVGQVRQTPVVFWGCWVLVGVGFTATLVSFILATVLWSGSAAFLGVVLAVFSAAGGAAMFTYYEKHGAPRRVKDTPVELYCKSCQQKLEDELKVGEEQRIAELQAELDQLTSGRPVAPALEAPSWEETA